jgi:hypothetical protein
MVCLSIKFCRVASTSVVIIMDTLLAICQIVPLFWMWKKVGVEILKGVQKTLIANSFQGQQQQEQQWNFHWFVFIVLFLLQSSSCNFFEVDEHFNGTTTLLYLVFCNFLPIEYGCLMYICECFNI